MKIRFISIHAPHEGVRRSRHCGQRGSKEISIHAPHEGVRRFSASSRRHTLRFQSTHPTRGCDGVNAADYKGSRISIHAPHEGVRQKLKPKSMILCNFNPRTPRGGATSGIDIQCGSMYFNPRTPRGGATSSHVLIFSFLHFNPRTPRGGATAICCSLISRVTTCCRPNITPLLDVVRFLNYCTNLLLFLGEPPRLFRTASGSPMSLHY